MTVKELIEELQKMPQDMLVFNKGYDAIVDRVFLYEKFPQGDIAHPSEIFKDVVMID